MKEKGKILAAILVVFMLMGCSMPYIPVPTETIPPNLYSPEDFVLEDGFLSCVAGETVLGIDVSRYQGDIDWKKVKAAGVEFVMVRLGNRGIAEGTLHEDPLARQNLQGAKAAGLKVGAYFYSQALNVAEAKEEATLALEILDGFLLDMPLAFDWEQESRTQDVDARTLTDCTKAFCDVVSKAGYQPMIYFNSFQAKELLHLRELKEIPWWLAMYDITMEFPYRMDMWQYSCTGTVPGIKGSVDLNLLFQDGMI